MRNVVSEFPEHLKTKYFRTISRIGLKNLKRGTDEIFPPCNLKECMSDSVTNYNYVGDTQKVYRLKKLMLTNAY